MFALSSENWFHLYSQPTDMRKSYDGQGNNRWVELSKIVPWDKFAAIYMSVMNLGTGRPGISPRTVLGALIIKHLEKPDDKELMEALSKAQLRPVEGLT